MSEKQVRHIGDDQLVHGMPKRMVGSAPNAAPKGRAATTASDHQGRFAGGSKKIVFWTVHPKAKACDKCKAMEGVKFSAKPERPHPNCKCDIRRHEYLPGKKSISGILEGGFGTGTVEVFDGRGYVDVVVTNIGDTQLPGIYVKTNNAGSRQAQIVGSGNSVTFDFNVFTDAMLRWSIMLEIKGVAHAVLEYVIKYEQ